MVYRLMQCMRLGLPPDFDVYDAATWTAPLPLSHASIKAGGVPQEVPTSPAASGGGPARAWTR